MRVLLILGNHKSLTHKVSLRLSCTHQTYLEISRPFSCQSMSSFLTSLGMSYLKLEYTVFFLT